MKTTPGKEQAQLGTLTSFAAIFNLCGLTACLERSSGTAEDVGVDVDVDAAVAPSFLFFPHEQEGKSGDPCTAI